MPDAPNSTVPTLSVASVEAALQLSVSLHLTAIEQYAAQAEHFGRWGYAKLAEAARAEAEDEREHLRKAMARLEFYDIQPTCDHDKPEWPRHDYEGILAANYALELKAMEAERGNVMVARHAGDELSASIFAELLAGSEASVKEIEATMRVIDQIGIDNFLANKV